MTKEKFIEFIKDLGFEGQTLDSFSLFTDVIGDPNLNAMSFCNQLNIHIDKNVELIQLSLSQISSHMASGKSFGNFSLKTFGNEGDFQLELFLSFIRSSFNKVPDSITKYMRDKRIKDILVK
jgi:hypothetical protein